jgi:hypothetical protein
MEYGNGEDIKNARILVSVGTVHAIKLYWAIMGVMADASHLYTVCLLLSRHGLDYKNVLRNTDNGSILGSP